MYLHSVVHKCKLWKLVFYICFDSNLSNVTRKEWFLTLFVVLFMAAAFITLWRKISYYIRLSNAANDWFVPCGVNQIFSNWTQSNSNYLIDFDWVRQSNVPKLFNQTPFIQLIWITFGRQTYWTVNWLMLWHNQFHSVSIWTLRSNKFVWASIHIKNCLC